MTVFDAEAEAQFRWGGLLVRGFARYTSGMRQPFEVGTRQFGSVTVRGRGNSWEAAFRDAALRTNNPVAPSPKKPAEPSAVGKLLGNRLRRRP